jgi:hypothetical protein
MAIVTNLALMTISQKIKIDEAALSQHQDRLGAERERALRALVARLPERFRPREDAVQDLPAREAAAKGSKPE